MVEINGTNVENKPHSDVVILIKSGGNQVSFVVADSEEAASKRNATSKPATTAGQKLISIERSAGLSFGFTLRDDGDRKGHIVTQINSGSPAELAGMTVGDRATEINGTNIQNLTTNDVVKIIKSGGDKVTLLLSGNFTNATDNTTNGSSEKAAPSVPTFTGSRVISIRKGQLGFGFTVQGLVGRRGHVIQDVESGLPAEQAGLKNNDYLIEVNGLNVENFNHAEIVSIIKDAGDSLTFVVCNQSESSFILRTSHEESSETATVEAATVAATAAAAVEVAAPPPAEVAPAAVTAVASTEVADTAAVTATTNTEVADAAATTAATVVVADAIAEKVEESNTTPVQNGHKDDPSRREVILHRGPKGFGFSLQCEKGMRGNYIQSVTPDGVADKAGLRNGDRVLEANGKDVENMSHPEVIQIVKAGGDTITFVVTDKKLEDSKAPTNQSYAPVAANELVFDNKERLLSKISKSYPTFDGNWQFKVENLNML